MSLSNLMEFKKDAFYNQNKNTVESIFFSTYEKIMFLLLDNTFLYMYIVCIIINSREYLMTPIMTRNRPVTEKQKNVLAFIRQYMAEFGYPPTIRDIASNFGITTHAAYYHLTALKTKGLIDWKEGASRTIRILKKGA